MDTDFSSNIDPFVVFDKSDEVTARQIEDEFIIVSIASKKKNRMADELYFLNETGRELWEKLNGQKNMHQLLETITNQYDTDCHEQIRRDVFGLIEDLLSHNIIIKVNKEG